MKCVRSDVPLAAFVRAGTGALIASILFGCAGPQNTERFYALNDGGVVVSNPATGTSAPARSLPGIIVSAVTVPELVDRPQIVTRDSVNGVIVSEQNLWAEPVRSGIARTLATRLGRTMQNAGKPVQVGAYPQSSITEPYLRVTIDIVRFDAVPNGEAVIDALWSVRRVADNSVQTGHTVAGAPIAGTGYVAIVAAWNEALRTVERDIGAHIVAIPLPVVSDGK